MSSKKVVHVTDSTFDAEVLNSKLPVLVDFWAEWCFPCRNIAPLIDEVADEYDGRLKVTKVDVDSNTVTPGKFGIRSIPALLIFKDGKVAGSMVGSVPKPKLTAFINENL